MYRTIRRTLRTLNPSNPSRKLPTKRLRLTKLSTNVRTSLSTAITLPTTLSLLALGVSNAHAQQDDVYELITTAIHVRSSETALPVTILNDEALHDAVRGTLGDTLANQPGINNASFGPAVGQTVIRGQQGRRVMNLNNGLPTADASGNSADHAQAVEPILANAIEVLRGPATLLYGGGAIGGVVNVIDRRIAEALPSQPAFAFEARHDTAADMNTVVGSLDAATGNLVWHVDAMQREWNPLRIPGLAIDPRYLASEPADEHELEHDEGTLTNTDGHIANTGGRTRAATLGGSWIFDQGFIGLAVNRLENYYGLPPGAHVHGHEDEHDHDHDHDHEHEHEHEDEHEDEHESEDELAHNDAVHIDMQRTSYDLAAEWRAPLPWLEKARYRLNYTDYAHAELEGPGLVGTRYHNTAWQQRLQLTHTERGGWHGVLGLQHSHEEFGARGRESFIPVSDIDALGVFLVEDFHSGQVTWEFGARWNYDDYRPQHAAAPARDFSTSSLSASALWDLGSITTLGLSLSRSQRAPSVEELYSNHALEHLEDCVFHFATGACEIGNSNFSAETSANADLTLYLDYGPLAATVTAFYNDFSDYIGQIADGSTVDGFPVRYYRQDDARFTGVEVDVNLRLNALASLRLFGDAINGRFDDTSDVPRMPTNRYGAELILQGERWSASAQVLHATAQGQPGAFEFDTAAWTRVDIGADYRLPQVTTGELLLFIKGRNLGDEEIRLSTSYLRGFAPEAGRSLEAGIRYRY